jgi:error-prone DNA polymerase
MFAEVFARSCFSFLEGASQPEDFIEQAVELGLPAIGIVDRDGIYGVARAEAALRRREKEGKVVPKLLVGADFSLVGTSATVALVVENAVGYTNLCRLLTEAHRDKDLRRPEASTSRGKLNIHRENLPVEGLSALLPAPYDSVVTDRVSRLFRGRVALVAHRHRLPDDATRERKVEALSEHFGVPILASARPFFHEASRRRLADVLTCIRLGVTLDEARKRLFSNGEARLRSEAEMRLLFADKPRWVDAAGDFAHRCHFRMRELGYRFPCFATQAGETPNEALRRLSFEYLPRRYPRGIPGTVRDQIEKELGLIRLLDVASYFLCVWEIVTIAREKGILCQGRGSAANSAVCFVLGITSVDPARSSLLFERFLSVERAEPPDIDVDFEHERREEVIQAIYERYGRDRAAMVSNVICYRGKSALREVGKVFGLSPEQTERLAGTVLWHDAADAQTDRIRQLGLDPNDARLSQVLELSSQMQGIPRHLGIHPGGFVLSQTTLSEVAPVQPARMEGRTVVPWDKDDLDVLGFFKVDVLGLGMLTAIRKTLELVRDPDEPGELDAIQALAEIPPELPAVYESFCRADTVGIFQIESRAQMAMLPNLKPRKFYDLVIEVAIVRPGPIQGGMVHPYLRRRAGQEPVSVPHECLGSILERTLGVPLFQEQVMQISMAGAGYSGGEADELRRDMAAWKRSGRLERHREKLLAGFRTKGISDAFSEALFEQIKGFGEYGFPESHAASFAILVYASGWLKVHHPAAFAAALVNSQPMGFYSPSAIFQDARRHGVEVRRLSIVHSVWDCTLEADDDARRRTPAIRLGFRLVKGLGEATANAIVDARKERSFETLHDLTWRAKLRKNELEALAEAGALDELVATRREAMWQSRAPRLPGLLAQTQLVEDTPRLPKLTRSEQLTLDYGRMGLSVTDHPLALLRPWLDARGVRSHAVIRETPHGKQVIVAGIVQSRQRPETASGVVFVTLEDETGWTNIILWAQIFEQFRTIVLNSTMLVVHGKLEREGPTIHVIAARISRLDGQEVREIRPPARDFR